MKIPLILSSGASGYMVLKDHKPHYYSSIKEVGSLIAELIEPETENDFVMLTISILKKKETTKEVKP